MIHEKKKHTCIVKWPDLKAEIKNWLADQRNSNLCVSKRTVISALRRLVGANDIMDSARTTSWSQRCTKNQQL
jgi:hypothetical protein